MINKKLIKLIPIKKLRHRLRDKYTQAEFYKKHPIYRDNFIGADVILSHEENMDFGGKVFVGDGGRFYAEGGLKIGAYTKFGQQCIIMTTEHNYKCDTRVPYDHRDVARPVEIGKNCWIGLRSIILGGIKIEDGAIVGAGSVVTKSVPKCAIVAGNPARIVGWRDKAEYERLEKAGLNFPQEKEPAYSLIFDDSGFRPFMKETKK